MNVDAKYRKTHHGNSIKRLRDILGIKQEVIASELGWTQQTVSKLEQKEQIDDETLQKVADVMHIPIDAIKNFNDEATVTFISNTFNDHNSSAITNFGNSCAINPVEKIIELYERLLKTEQEKLSMLKADKN